MTDEPERADVTAVLECLASGWLTMGPRIAALETAWREMFGATHAFAVAGEAAAVQLTLLSAGVGPDDMVAVPALAPAAVLAGVRAAGARLVAVDVQAPGWPLIDVDGAEAALSHGARALLAVHLDGLPAPAAALAERAAATGALLIETVGPNAGMRLADGRPAGAAGAAATFDLTAGALAVGEGGIVSCHDDALAEGVRLRRSHAMTSGTWDRHRGYADSYDVLAVGFNYRLDELRAALALSRLARLKLELTRRREFVRALASGLRERAEVAVEAPPGVLDGAAPADLPIAFPDRRRRDAASAALRAAGLPIRTWTPWREARGAAPVAASAASRMLVVGAAPGPPGPLAEHALAALCA